MACNPETLRKVPLFALLDDDEIAVLASQVELQTFAPRQRIYKAGEAGGRGYIVGPAGVPVTTVEEDQQEWWWTSRLWASSSDSRPCWTRRRTRPARRQPSRRSASKWTATTSWCCWNASRMPAWICWPCSASSTTAPRDRKST